MNFKTYFCLLFVAILINTSLGAVQKQKETEKVPLKQFLYKEQTTPSFLQVLQCSLVDTNYKFSNRVGLSTSDQLYRDFKRFTSIIDLESSKDQYSRTLDSLSNLLSQMKSPKKGGRIFKQTREIKAVLRFLKQHDAKNIKDLPKESQVAVKFYRLKSKGLLSLKHLRQFDRQISNSRCLQGYIYEEAAQIITGHAQAVSLKEQAFLLRAAKHLRKTMQLKKAAKLYHNLGLLSQVNRVIKRSFLDALELYMELDDTLSMHEASQQFCIQRNLCNRSEIGRFAEKLAPWKDKSSALSLYRHLLKKYPKLSDHEMADVLAKIAVLSKDAKDIKLAYDYIREANLSRRAPAFLTLARFEVKGLSTALDKSKDKFKLKKFKLSYLRLIERKAKELFLTADPEVLVVGSYLTGKWFETVYQEFKKESLFLPLFHYSTYKTLKEKMKHWYQMSYKFYLSHPQYLIPEGQAAYDRLSYYWEDEYKPPLDQELKINLDDLIPRNFAPGGFSSTYSEKVWLTFQQKKYAQTLKMLLSHPNLMLEDAHLTYLDTICLLKLGYLKEASESLKQKRNSTRAKYFKALTAYLQQDLNGALRNLQQIKGKSRAQLPPLEKVIHLQTKRFDLALALR